MHNTPLPTSTASRYFHKLVLGGKLTVDIYLVYFILAEIVGELLILNAAVFGIINLPPS